jgi:hypothetical protein
MIGSHVPVPRTTGRKIGRRAERATALIVLATMQNAFRAMMVLGVLTLLVAVSLLAP